MNMSEESVWKKITWILIGTVISGMVSLGVYYVQSNFLQRTPKLLYSSLSSIPFSGEESNISIYHVEIANAGRLTIKNINCVIIIEQSIIEEYNMSVEPSILYSEEILGDRFNLEIPMLNSKEKMSVSLLTTSTGELPTKAEVSLRGEGVIGREYTILSDIPSLQIYGISISGNVLFFLVSVIIPLIIVIFQILKQSRSIQ